LHGRVLHFRKTDQPKNNWLRSCRYSFRGSQPFEEVSQNLGHANTAITYRTYARFTSEHPSGAAAILNFDEPRKVGRWVQTTRGTL